MVVLLGAGLKKFTATILCTKSDFKYLDKKGRCFLENKFKPGDRVYHKTLELYGTFVDHSWEAGECYVDFEMPDGYVEQRRVTLYWLEKV